MKLSLREKILSMFLVVTVVFAASYFLLLKPRLENMAFLAKENASYRKKIEEVKRDMASADKLKEEINYIGLMIEDETESFFPAILQDKIIMTLDQLAKKSSVKPSGNKFGNITVAPVRQNAAQSAAENIFVIKEFADQYNSMLSKAQQKEGGKTVKRPVYQAESMSVSFGLEGSYGQLVRFIKEMETLNRTVVINSIAFANSGQDQILKASMQVDFYALPKLGDQDSKYFDWSINHSYGKINPFTK